MQGVDNCDKVQTMEIVRQGEGVYVCVFAEDWGRGATVVWSLKVRESGLLSKKTELSVPCTVL